MSNSFAGSGSTGSPARGGTRPHRGRRPAPTPRPTPSPRRPTRGRPTPRPLLLGQCLRRLRPGGACHTRAVVSACPVTTSSRPGSSGRPGRRRGRYRPAPYVGLPLGERLAGRQVVEGQPFDPATTTDRPSGWNASPAVTSGERELGHLRPGCDLERTPPATGLLFGRRRARPSPAAGRRPRTSRDRTGTVPLPGAGCSRRADIGSGTGRCRSRATGRPGRTATPSRSDLTLSITLLGEESYPTRCPIGREGAGPREERAGHADQRAARPARGGMPRIPAPGGGPGRIRTGAPRGRWPLPTS